MFPERIDLTFENLVDAIRLVHDRMTSQAKKAVNISLTLRNWAIGFYIREYEQNGSDRAEYGIGLIEKLSRQLKHSGKVDYHPRELRRCRTFYCVYPQIWGTLSPEFEKILPLDFQKYTSLRTSDDNLPAKRGTPSPGSGIAPDKLIKSLSYSHFAELIEIEDPLKRAFYEVESILGNWSVRELKRQIDSLYYERSGLSKNKKKLAKLVQKGVEKSAPELAIRDPYIFEFLGLRPEQVIPESDLENELIIRLQEFLMELGTGFCFEARQKRILIGDTYGFIDLVFYHRVLKCHVLVELKRSRFTHEDIGQLNTYVSWYKKNISSDDDNPPIGILLCTKKDHTLVEYALAGMSNQLFVSKYQLELPSREEIIEFIEEQAHGLYKGPRGVSFEQGSEESKHYRNGKVIS